MTGEGSAAYREALRCGEEAAGEGRSREAIDHFTEATRLDARRPEAWVSLGLLLLQLGQSREALQAFETALDHAPRDIGALRGKAYALEDADRVAEAQALLDRAADLEALAWPGQAAGKRTTRSVTDRPRSPQQTVSGRVPRPPGPVATHSTAPGPRVAPAGESRRSELERLVAQGEQARAAGELDRAAAAFHRAAVGYAAEGAFEVALDACLRALEARPGAIDVHFTMAHLYLRRGWANLGVQRVQLIDHRLDIDADPRRRAALQALAHDFQALHPALADIGSARA